MDEVFKSELHYQDHTEVLTHKLSQPSEQIILDQNARKRNSPGMINDLGAKSEGGTWGRHMANIPMIIYEQAKKDGYELDSTDSKHQQHEMTRFLQTPMGKACLIQGD